MATKNPKSLISFLSRSYATTAKTFVPPRGVYSKLPGMSDQTAASDPLPTT